MSKKVYLEDNKVKSIAGIFIDKPAVIVDIENDIFMTWGDYSKVLPIFIMMSGISDDYTFINLSKFPAADIVHIINKMADPASKGYIKEFGEVYLNGGSYASLLD